MKRLVVALAMLMLAANTWAQSLDEQIELLRQAHNTDREALITLNVHFTSAESQAFWPLYREYRQAMRANGDMRLGVIKEFALVYDTITDDQANALLKRSMDVRQDALDTRRVYAMRFAEILPGKKVARIMQIESKLDAAIDMELAANIPIVKP